MDISSSFIGITFYLVDCCHQLMWKLLGHVLSIDNREVSFSVMNLHLHILIVLLNLMIVFYCYFFIFDYAMDSMGFMGVCGCWGCGCGHFCFRQSWLHVVVCHCGSCCCAFLSHCFYLLGPLHCLRLSNNFIVVFGTTRAIPQSTNNQ